MAAISGPSSSAPVTKALQATLVDLIDLSLAGKQAHWNVYGPHFRSVHLELDEIIASARTSFDTVAERLSQLGEHPDGRARTVAETSKLDDVGSGPLGTDKVVLTFAEQVNAVSERIKNALPDLEEDLLSQDLLIKVAQILDQHAWFLRAQAQ